MHQCFGLAWFGMVWQILAKLRETELSWYLFEIHPKDIQCHPNTRTPKFLRPKCAMYFKADNFKRKSDAWWSLWCRILSQAQGCQQATVDVLPNVRSESCATELSTSFNVFNTSFNLKSCAKFLLHSSVRHSNFWTILSSGFVLPFCLVLVVLGLCVPLFALRWSLNQHREALCATA